MSMGKRSQLDLGAITFGRVVSSDSSGGGSPSTYILWKQTRFYLDEIALGRVVSSQLGGGHL